MRCIFFFCFFSLLFGCQNNAPKTAYVQGQLVFDGFAGKKEMQNKLTQEMNQQKAVLDSIKVQAMRLGNSKENETKIAQLQEQYQILYEEHQVVGQQKMAEFSQEIWKQINEYSREFAEKNGYDYLFGAMGNGSLMYASPQYDVTEQLIQYINAKYEGE